jgi:hypothetical protein
MPAGRHITVKNDIERNSPFGDDHGPATGLEVRLLTLAMQEMILAEGYSRGWKDMSLASNVDGQLIHFKVYKDKISVQAALDVRILRHVEMRNLKTVLMDHAKGLLDMIYGRENLSALEKRRIEREELLASMARVPKL